MALSQVSVCCEMKQGFRTEVTASHNFIIDQPKTLGGTDEGANPLEVFLSSLGGCVCAIGRIIAMQRKMDVRAITCKVEGDIDKSVLMGKSKEGRAGFTEIRTYVNIDADMTLEEKQSYLEEIESRCPIADNILHLSTIKPIVVNAEELAVNN
jgi:uncharacterized OsmC-like protein